MLITVPVHCFVNRAARKTIFAAQPIRMALAQMAVAPGCPVGKAIGAKQLRAEILVRRVVAPIKFAMPPFSLTSGAVPMVFANFVAMQLAIPAVLEISVSPAFCATPIPSFARLHQIPTAAKTEPAAAQAIAVCRAGWYAIPMRVFACIAERRVKSAAPVQCAKVVWVVLHRELVAFAKYHRIVETSLKPVVRVVLAI